MSRLTNFIKKHNFIVFLAVIVIILIIFNMVQKKENIDGSNNIQTDKEDKKDANCKIECLPPNICFNQISCIKEEDKEVIDYIKSGINAQNIMTYPETMTDNQKKQKYFIEKQLYNILTILEIRILQNLELYNILLVQSPEYTSKKNNIYLSYNEQLLLQMLQMLKIIQKSPILLNNKDIQSIKDYNIPNMTKDTIINKLRQNMTLQLTILNKHIEELYPNEDKNKVVNFLSLPEDAPSLD